MAERNRGRCEIGSIVDNAQLAGPTADQNRNLEPGTSKWRDESGELGHTAVKQ